MDMGTRYGVLAANVNEDNQKLFMRFKEAVRTLGFTNTRALEQAVRLWLDTYVTEDGKPWYEPRVTDGRTSGAGPDSSPADPFAVPDPEPESLIPPPVPEYRRPAPTENPW